MHHQVLQRLTCHQTLQPAREAQTNCHDVCPWVRKTGKSKRRNRSDCLKRLPCLPVPQERKAPVFQGQIFASQEEKMVKSMVAKRRKRATPHHTTSSGKGPFSGPLVCRLLSRPNRVSIHTS